MPVVEQREREHTPHSTLHTPHSTFNTTHSAPSSSGRTLHREGPLLKTYWSESTYHRADFSRLALRHGSLNSHFPDSLARTPAPLPLHQVVIRARVAALGCRLTGFDRVSGVASRGSTSFWRDCSSSGRFRLACRCRGTSLIRNTHPPRITRGPEA